jgi:hypothetical protein
MHKSGRAYFLLLVARYSKSGESAKYESHQDLFAEMDIGRDCSSPLHFGSLALSSIPLRSQTLPCFPGVAALRYSTPTARRVALSPSAAPARSSHTAARNVRHC